MEFSQHVLQLTIHVRTMHLVQIKMGMGKQNVIVQIYLGLKEGIVMLLQARKTSHSKEKLGL